MPLSSRNVSQVTYSYERGMSPTQKWVIWNSWIDLLWLGKNSLPDLERNQQMQNVLWKMGQSRKRVLDGGPSIQLKLNLYRTQLYNWLLMLWIPFQKSRCRCVVRTRSWSWGWWWPAPPRQAAPPWWLASPGLSSPPRRIFTSSVSKPPELISAAKSVFILLYYILHIII